MRFTHSTWFVVVAVLASVLTACSSNAPTTTPTRAATQTPWLIYVPVTVTPEPAVATPLPTVGAPLPTARIVPTTRPITARPPTAKPTAVPPVAAKPTAVPAPTCSYGTVTLKEPEDNALRQTKATGIGGDTFRFIWEPPATLQGEAGSNVGYKLSVNSRRGGFTNGATLYLSHNAFMSGKYTGTPKLFVLDKPAVSALASGESVEVTWSVVIIQSTGGINENDPWATPNGVATCGPSSELRRISLKTFGD